MFCAISSFATMFSKSRLLQRRHKASIGGKGLNETIIALKTGKTVVSKREIDHHAQFLPLALGFKMISAAGVSESISKRVTKPGTNQYVRCLTP